MRWTTWWQIVIALQAHCFVQSMSSTICAEEPCRCDPFTRVICNCNGEHELTLRSDDPSRVPSMATDIIIDGCSRVYILSETIHNLHQLSSVQLRNIGEVIIYSRALAWTPISRNNDMDSGISIIIENSTVSELASHAVQGHIKDIFIRNSRIHNMKPYAFSSLYNVNNIELTENVFKNIETMAFKQFTTETFLLRGGTIVTLPSRFLSDVEVTRLFRIDGVTISFMTNTTFVVNLPKKVLVENNVIGTVGGTVFQMTTRGPITFRNNTIHSLSNIAFRGISTHSEILSIMGPQELLIDNNTVTDLTPLSLNHDGRTIALRVDGLNINKSCSCELAEEWRSVLKNQGGTISCWYELENYFVTVPTYMDSRCGTFKQNFWIFVVIGVVLVIIVAAIVIFVLVRRENDKKKKLQIVMPDGKTYRETEFHIVVERAELLTTDL